MGSTPESIRYMLTQLQCRPHIVTWGPIRPVTVWRGANKKLGFHFKTYPCGENETATVIVHVKEQCQVGEGKLHVGDRVVSVNNQSVVALQELDVKDILSHAPPGPVLLHVSAMNRADPNSQVKRFLSFNSGASGGSNSVNSERPQVKRFAKSYSTETPPPSSPHSDLDPTDQRAAQPLAGACNSENGSAKGSHSRSLPLASHPYPHFLASAHQLPPCHQYSSLPARMESDIIITDDIVIEYDGPNSLPAALTPHSNAPTSLSSATPSSSSSTLSPAFFTSVSSIDNASTLATGSFMGIGSDSDGGVGEELSRNRSMGVEVCRAPDCGLQRKCLWHQFVLTYPQFVVWDPFTKTVQLEKKNGAHIDFKYKVKKFEGPPMELFALVTEVTYGGVAWKQLLPGDWIRSVNNIAVTKEAFNTNFQKLTSVRLVIQRPNSLSPKGLSRLRKHAQSMHIKLLIPPPSVPFSNSAPPSLAPTTSSPQPVQSHLFSVGARDGAGTGAGARMRDLNQYHSSPPGVDLAILERYPGMAHSPGEHIPLATLNRSSPHPKCPPSPVSPSLPTLSSPFTPVTTSSLMGCSVLPQARVVVCGTHGSAMDFVRGLLAEQEGLNIDPEASVQSFHFTLHHSGSEDDFGNVSVRPYSETLATALQAQECECKGACGGGGGSGKQEGGAGRTGGHSVGVELYMVSSEEFFHQCLPWLLPSTTLVLLTFHVNKLLNQPEPETVTRRLATMVHTVRAYCTRTTTNNNNHSSVSVVNRPAATGANHNAKSKTTVKTACKTRLLNASCTPAVLLYGVPSGAHDASAEEVQAIFYVTDSGNRLLEHHAVLEPSISVPSCMAEARLQVFSACQTIVSSSMVQPHVAMVAEALSARSSGVRFSGRELSGLVAHMSGGDVDPVAVQSVVQDLVTTGSLIICDSSRASSEAVDPDYLVPAAVFEALAALLFSPSQGRHGSEYNQRWFRLLATGRATRSELQDILTCEGSPLTLDMLESLGIAFRLQSSTKGDSGFEEDAVEFVIPFFLVDTADDKVPSGGQKFVLTFKGYLTWRDYFEMLCRVSALPATDEVVLRGRNDCEMVHNGVRLWLHCRKSSDSDTIVVSAVRLERQQGEEVTVQSLERLFRHVIPPALQFDLRPASAASPSSNIVPSSSTCMSSPHGPGLDPEETYCKQAETSSQGLSSTAASAQGSRQYSDMRLVDLPWSVLTDISLYLSVAMTTSKNDWHAVAEKAGKSMVKISSYEVVKTPEVPAMTFLRDWMNVGTVQQLLDILEELERPDVIDVILNHLERREEQS